MDMEKLTKQQIVLVTLLVSFVTSIATGIVTVALMDQAPVGVTQTINRVVERTIEKVVTPPTSGNTAAVITRETVVVKEDDKIVESVEKNKDSIVRIYTNTRNIEDRIFIGLGTIISSQGLIATGDVFADVQGKYIVQVSNDTVYPVQILPKKEAGHVYFLKIIKEENNSVTFTPVVFSNSDNLKLGQTVIAWGGNVRNSVSTGIISSLLDVQGKVAEATTTSKATTTAVVREIIGINTNTNLSDSISGGPLLNLYGEIVGIRISPNLSTQYNFLPANILKQEAVGL